MFDFASNLSIPIAMNKKVLIYCILQFIACNIYVGLKM